MKVRLIKPGSNLEGPLPVGTILSGPDMFRLCEVGMAEPADEECYALVKSRGKVRRLADRKDLVFVVDPVEDEAPVLVEAPAALVEAPVAPVQAPVEVKATSDASGQNETPGNDSTASPDANGIG